MYKFCGVLLFYIFFLWLFVQNVAVTFKMTKVECETHNKSWVVIPHCRLKARSRNVTKLNITANVLHEADNIFLHLVLKKKANGYKPFLMDVKLDACGFMRRHNHPFVNIVYNLMQDFSSITHKCPYIGEQYVRDFYLDAQRLKGLPFPTGDYLLLLKWIFDTNKPAFSTNIYFMFVEDL